MLLCVPVQSILYHIQCIISGYICPLSQLSAYDMAVGSESTRHCNTRRLRIECMIQQLTCLLRWLALLFEAPPMVAIARCWAAM